MLIQEFGRASDIEALHKRTADADGDGVVVAIEKEKGSAGVGNMLNYQEKVLEEYEVIDDKPTGKKAARARGIVALHELGLFFVLRSPAYDQLITDAIRTFTPQGTGSHIDVIDATSGLHKMLLEYEWPPKFNWSV